MRVIDDSGESIVSVESEGVSFCGEILTDREGGFSLVAEEDGFVLTEGMLSARDSADQNGAFMEIQSRWAM